MKRILRIGLALALALILAMAFSAPVFAGGGGEADVDLSDIDAPSEGYVGDEVTASGTVTITAGTDLWGGQQAESNAWYSVTAPDSTMVDNGSNSEADLIPGYPDPFIACPTDASQVYNWSSTFTLTQAGDWVVSQGGDAYAEWSGYFGIWLLTWSDSDWNFATIVATFAPPAETYGIPDRDFLAIMLPGGKTYAEYNGKALCYDVDFSDGTWRIQIPRSTYIMSSNGTKPSCLRINEDGEIVNGISFANGEPVITRM